MNGEVVGHVSFSMKSSMMGRFLGMAFVPAAYSAIGSEFDVLVRSQPKEARGQAALLHAALQSMIH
jgi:aminomethyltransferase